MYCSNTVPEPHSSNLGRSKAQASKGLKAVGIANVNGSHTGIHDDETFFLMQQSENIQVYLYQYL